MMNRHKTIPVLLLICLLSGCGYHTAMKGGSQIPNLNTLAVPVFVNQSTTYKVEQRLTSAVVKELLKRTNYKLVYREDSSADATLRCTVTGVGAGPATYDPQTARASTMIVGLTMQVKLVSLLSSGDLDPLKSDLSTFFDLCSRECSHDCKR